MRRVVARALVRDPADRLRDIGDARIALTHPEEIRDGVEIPIWAPDSNTIAYVSEGSIWRQSLSGTGAPTRVAGFPELAAGGGGIWDPAGRLLVAMGSTELYSIPERGGEASVLLAPDPDLGEGHFHRATVLPGGDLAYVLHRADGTADTIGVLAADGERHNLLTLPGDYLADLWYWPGGALVFSRRGPGGNGLWVLPLDPDALEQTGEPVMLIPGAAAPSLSADGRRLLYAPDPVDVLTAGRARIGHLSQNLSRTREGFVAITQYESLMGERGGQRISPDGRRVAFSIRDESGSDLWTLDLDRGTRERMTDDTSFDSEPAWSPDGEWIYYMRNDAEVARVRADGSAEVQVLGPGRRPAVIPGSGRLIVLRRPGVASDGDELWFLDTEGTGEAEPFRTGRPVFGSADASRDGRLIAYGSRETNRWEILVEDLETGQRWQISDGGGEDPRRGPDGDLYYVAPPRMLTRLPVTRPDDDAPEFGDPESIVEVTPSFGVRDIQPVMIDGELRFLTSEREPVDTGGGRLVVALNADRMIREALGR